MAKDKTCSECGQKLPVTKKFDVSLVFSRTINLEGVDAVSESDLQDKLSRLLEQHDPSELDADFFEEEFVVEDVEVNDEDCDSIQITEGIYNGEE